LQADINLVGNARVDPAAKIGGDGHLAGNGRRIGPDAESSGRARAEKILVSHPLF